MERPFFIFCLCRAVFVVEAFWLSVRFRVEGRGVRGFPETGVLRFRV